MLKELPLQVVAVEDLPALVNDASEFSISFMRH